MNKSKIEWTEETWNPITGCDKHSDGCLNCYAEKMAKRLFCMKNPRYINNFKLTIHNDLFKRPLEIRKSKIIFVCSMSDLFHEKVPFKVIDEIFDVMEKANWHIFQVLTKRTERLIEYASRRKIPNNVWLGTTLESNKYYYRAELLKQLNCSVKFLSCEPLISDLYKLDVKGIDWIVVGGESGPNARPVKKEWIINIKDKCIENKVPFFFKQWGGWNKKKNGHELDGEIYKQMPNI